MNFSLASPPSCLRQFPVFTFQLVSAAVLIHVSKIKLGSKSIWLPKSPIWTILFSSFAMECSPSALWFLSTTLLPSLVPFHCTKVANWLFLAALFSSFYLISYTHSTSMINPIPYYSLTFINLLSNLLYNDFPTHALNLVFTEKYSFMDLKLGPISLAMACCP